MTERYRSGTPRASDHWQFPDESPREPRDTGQFGNPSHNGKRHPKEQRGITDYRYCDLCDWKPRDSSRFLFEVLHEFQRHNDEEHNGHGHLTKR